MPPEPTHDLNRSWNSVLEAIGKERGAGELDAWLRGSRLLRLEQGVAVVEVPTQLHQERMSDYVAAVRTSLGVSDCQVVISETDIESALFSPEFALQEAAPAAAGPNGSVAPRTLPAGAAPSGGISASGSGRPLAPAGQPGQSALHPDYNFDAFVVGGCNRFAHAAALAVCDRPARAFNPLFLHGSVGLGKTHLVQSIAHGLRERLPEARTLYLSCEQFTNHFILSLRQGSFDSFRDRYRQADLLIVDDIHLLANKQRTQEEFFHTFNELHAAGKQIVLSSDAPPQEIPSLQDRLVSRFKWGLVAEIEKPYYETRVAILLRKADRLGFELSDAVARFLAEHVVDNVRELEGALVQLKALAALDGQPINLRLAQRALQSSAAAGRRVVRMEDVLEAVVGQFGAKLADLQSKRRSQSVVGPRQVAMFLARKLTPMSLEEIGAYFGGRDHSTVIYAIQKVADRMRVDGEYARRIGDVERVARHGQPRRATA